MVVVKIIIFLCFIGGFLHSLSSLYSFKLLYGAFNLPETSSFNTKSFKYIVLKIHTTTITTMTVTNNIPGITFGALWQTIGTMTANQTSTEFTARNFEHVTHSSNTAETQSRETDRRSLKISQILTGHYYSIHQ